MGMKTNGAADGGGAPMANAATVPTTAPATPPVTGPRITGNRSDGTPSLCGTEVAFPPVITLSSEESMKLSQSLRSAVLATAILVPSAALPLAAQATTAAAPAKHHSKFKGALVGAAAGHMVGHAKAGAVVGAMVQHHRNKKARG